MRPGLFLTIVCLSAIGFSSAFADDVAPPKKAGWKKLIAKTADPNPVPVTGVRGLDKSSGEMDTSARDYPAIDRLEKVKVNPQELDAFKAEGGLK